MASGKFSNNRVVILLLSLALLGTWIYILWDKNRVQQQKKESEQVIANTTIEKDQLQKELEEAANRFDLLKTASTKKDSMIIERDREIGEKKSKISALLSKVNASRSELNEARKLIAEMNNDLDSYKKQIELLEGQKIQLTQEKAVLTEDRDRLSRRYDSARQSINEKDEIIDVASTLQTSNFSITGIKTKASGKETTTSKAKRVDKLSISFDLNENRITLSGNKQLYVIITDPMGQVVLDAKLGSGTFLTREGQEKKFTQKLDINYTQSKRQTIRFDWNGSTPFISGQYRIEVYNNGFKVGDAATPLR